MADFSASFSGVGIIMGILYTTFGLQAPALLGAITAILAMIPFGAPVIITIIGLILLAQGKIISAIVILSAGAIVMFVADHFIRPSMISGATRLPFLAVLFGVLGGIETLGLIGLFIGPVVMVLFMTLLNEPVNLEEKA